MDMEDQKLDMPVDALKLTHEQICIEYDPIDILEPNVVVNPTNYFDTISVGG